MGQCEGEEVSETPTDTPAAPSKVIGTIYLLQMADGHIYEGLFLGTYGILDHWDALPFLAPSSCPRFTLVDDMVAFEPVVTFSHTMTELEYGIWLKAVVTRMAAKWADTPNPQPTPLNPP